ncbi:MAG: hypothetical protein KA240_02470 [Nitrospira sp.]|jgi:hypothetical protein|nr:hypothetical protein [Nitrospira sp.]MBP6604520.1 hypothetical protein [Nitrospira sp.]HQY57890.1 hypothetical protein [Nitrospira sp.]
MGGWSFVSREAYLVEEQNAVVREALLVGSELLVEAREPMAEREKELGSWQIPDG